MRTLLLAGMLMAVLISCNRKKYADATEYNDRVVGFIEQCERSMKVWNTTNFMQEYTLKKHNTVMRLLNMQDSINTIEPLAGDDSLRQMAMYMVDNYIQTFAIYDTVYAMLSDSVYYPEDSIAVQTLLKANQDTLANQAQRFAALQQRFSARYGLTFIE